MVTEWWEILDKLKKKRKRKNTISLFVPPLEAPGAPQFKNHCSRLQFPLYLFTAMS